MSCALPSEATLTALQRSQHRDCFLCGPESPSGMRLAFSVHDDRSVSATFLCERLLQSYPGMLHGGMTAAVLDAAMTNALFAVGVVGLTAELTIRFLAPVMVDRAATVRASIVRSGPHGLHLLEAALEQDGRPCARATAKFLEQPSR
jgi:acyl-coenzyme A thioesterase PaaI-like protein